MGVKTGRGYLTQNFEIRLDVDKLGEFIKNKVLEAIESEKTNGKQIFTDVRDSDSYFNGDEFFIAGRYETAFKSWHCDATLESPEENDLDYEGIEGWGDGILCMLPDYLKELVSVYEINADEDMVEFPEPEPPDYWYED